MNNIKFFVVVALILGGATALFQVFFAFFNKTPTQSSITADAIQLLPEHLDTDQLSAFTERASKYLILSAKQFEDGVDPASLEATPSVTPTPTL